MDTIELAANALEMALVANTIASRLKLPAFVAVRFRTITHRLRAHTECHSFATKSRQTTEPTSECLWRGGASRCTTRSVHPGPATARKVIPMRIAMSVRVFGTLVVALALMMLG